MLGHREIRAQAISIISVNEAVHHSTVDQMGDSIIFFSSMPHEVFNFSNFVGDRYRFFTISLCKQDDERNLSKTRET